jgi:opacity protein-like surface antigen
MRSRLRVVVLALVCLAGAASASAQQQAGDPFDTARLRFGPFGITPALVIRDVGRDNNVFNDGDTPLADNTATVGPQADIVFRLGRSRLAGKAGAQYLYFQEYETQRGWNTNLDGTWRFPLARIAPFVLGTRASSKDRRGFEIDTRARVDDRAVGFGSEINFSSKTSLVLTGKRNWLRYADDEQYFGVNLSDRLNRHTDSEELLTRVRLTPLTSWVVSATAIQDRFDTSSLRNTDSYQVMTGFELRPQALISGEAFVGVRRFATLSALIPDSTGLTARVKTRYTLRATQIALTVDRDLAYSYDEFRPYYGVTSVGTEVTERITSAWDIVARGSRQWLTYRTLTTYSGPAQPDDIGWTAGAGVGYRVGGSLRIGFDANYYTRTGGPGRTYEGLRLGGSLTYGLPQ